MLLDFKCKNFKSFKEECDFRMQPERITELSYSVIKHPLKKEKKEVKALAASVIYGPNASGKTSIINAMSCFRQIVMNGNIEDSVEDKAGDHVSAHMELIPFSMEKDANPVEFDISFEEEGIKYRYVIGFVVGAFAQKNGKRYIVKESLYINDKLILDRGVDDVKELELKSVREYLNIGYSMEETGKYRKMMEDNLSEITLLLFSDFYSFCSKLLVSNIKDWFIKKFIIVNSSDKARFLPVMAEEAGKAVIDKYINEIAKTAGIIGTDFAYVSDTEKSVPKLISLIKNGSGELVGLNSDIIESLGTLRLISIMSAVLIALQTGSVLVMDELDASIHPMIVMNIVNMFHNDEVNVHGAQIIFNTHNPIYLDGNVLRRDEIKFVEKDKESKGSMLYSLSDFKTNASGGTRKTSDYLKNYFVGRYGAIEYIDFTDIILKMMKDGGAADAK